MRQVFLLATTVVISATSCAVQAQTTYSADSVAEGIRTPLSADRMPRQLRRKLFVSPAGRARGPGTRRAPYDLQTVLAGGVTRPGDLVWLMAGVYPGPEAEVQEDVLDEQGQPTGAKRAVRRRVAFISEIEGDESRPVVVRAVPGERVILDGWLEVKGSDTWFWGFEIADSRYAGTGHTKAELEELGVRTSIDVYGARTRFINLDVHDGAMGFGFWKTAVDSEIYGCVIHGFGYGGKDRGHGHAIYAQNDTGTKRIVDNVMFAGCGWNLHIYTEGGAVRGFHVEGNTAFSAGMFAGDWKNDSYLLMAHRPLDRIVFMNNVAYDPRTGGRPIARLSSYGPTNESGVCKDNYLMGLKGLLVDHWNDMTVSGNTAWPEGEKERPTENAVFVRPNLYEAGRGHVSIFNWEGLEAVRVDLGRILSRGARFEVHNVQDLHGEPVASGKFDGEPVALPVLRSRIAPDFDAFLVRQVAR